jgi:hypothetical protein
MTGHTPGTAITRQGEGHLDLSGREHQVLWFALARLPWNSVVLVPADQGGSTAHLALALADIGAQLSIAPVSSIVAQPRDYRTAVQMAAGVSPAGWEGEQVPFPRAGRVIISIEPIVVEPLGVAVVQAADTAVVCVELGRTGLAAARRTVELIGRERVAGCFLVG